MMIERLPDQGVDKIGITNEMGLAIANSALRTSSPLSRSVPLSHSFVSSAIIRKKVSFSRWCNTVAPKIELSNLM